MLCWSVADVADVSVCCKLPSNSLKQDKAVMHMGIYAFPPFHSPQMIMD